MMALIPAVPCVLVYAGEQIVNERDHINGSWTFAYVYREFDAESLVGSLLIRR